MSWSRLRANPLWPREKFAELVHSGRRRKLHRDGKAREALREGWSVTAINSGFAPDLLILLEHIDGNSARWIVDWSGETYDEPLAQIPDPVRGHIHCIIRHHPHHHEICKPETVATWNLTPTLT